jgi:hypothetical protein
MKEISKGLKTTFLIHAVVGLIFGLPMLIVPGRFARLINWSPIDPVVNRLLGAAFLALAVSSWRAYKSATWEKVEIKVEIEIVFTVLGVVGLLRHLLFLTTPAFAWVNLVILAAFAVAWIVFYLRR